MLRKAAIVLLLVASSIADCPLGSIYDSYFDKCYKYVYTPMSFFDADHHCNALGGHLVDERNAFENSYIAGMASGASAQTPNFWIGANLLRSSNWTWTSDAPMSYTNWASGEPNNAYSCAFLNGAGATWTTLPCNHFLPFMCKISPNAVPQGNCSTQSPPTTAPSTCPNDSQCSDGYTLYTGNCLCYKFFNSTYLSFSEANNTCGNNGGMLAKIPSKDVNDFLTVLPGFDTIGCNFPWIGLSCTSNTTSSCSWVDGTPLGSYTNFVYLKPYPYALEAARGDGKWIMITSQNYCNGRAYLCQKASTRANLLLKDVAQKTLRNEREGNVFKG